MRYVIIGAGPAGLSAAETIRRYDSTGGIVVLSAEKEPPYARHLLPDVLGGQMEESSLTLRPADFFAQKRIELRAGEKVEEIDADNAVVATTDGRHAYDKLLIATGGRPVLPRLSLLNVNGVFVLRTIADARRIDSFLRREKVRKAAVVGSGIVGLKVACMLHHRGIDVSIVEKESRLLPRVLDPDSLGPVSRLCWENGFKIVLGERFREFLTSGKEKKVSHLVTYSGRSIPCDAAIMCPGVAPNIALAKSMSLNMHRGIVVDDHMCTSVENIFAAGDVVETKNAATGKTVVMPLWPNASEQGHVAGANMAGRRVAYAGAVWQNSLHVFGLTVVTLGQSYLADKVPAAKVLASPTLKRGRGARLVFSGDRLIGATLLGDVGAAGFYKRIIRDRVPAWELREELFKESFDPSRLYLRFGIAEVEDEANDPGRETLKRSPV